MSGFYLFMLVRIAGVTVLTSHQEGAVPQIKSAKKRQRQTESRTRHNRIQRSELRTAVKKVRQAASKDEAAAALKRAEVLIDRASGKNLIHHNAANRQKSRLHKAVAGMS
jgi:small subunit ribosomal protein S20